MDARPLAVAAGVVVMAALFVWLRRDLKRLGAPWTAHAVVAIAYGAAAGGWAAVFLRGAPPWVGWVASLAAIAATVAPRAVVRLTVGRSPERTLVEEVGAIRQALSTLTTSRLARARLRSKARELDRWRSESGTEPADELIDLVQTGVYARLDGMPRDPDEEDAREEQIKNLLVRLEG